jgi:hypothetical protein
MLQNSFPNDLTLQYSNNNSIDADDDLTNDIKYQLDKNYNNSAHHQQQPPQQYNIHYFYENNYQNSNTNNNQISTTSSTSSSSSSPYGDYSSSYYYANGNNNDYQLGTQSTSTHHDNIYVNNYAITTKIEIDNVDNNGQFIDNMGIHNGCCFTDDNHSPINDYHLHHHHHIYNTTYDNMTVINNNENNNHQQQYSMMLKPVVQKKFKRKFKDLFEPPINLNEPNVTTIMQKPVCIFDFY